MTQHKLLTALLALLAIGTVAITGAAAVEVYNEQIDVGDGDTVTVDVEITDEFINDSEASTSVDVQLEDDTGSVVNSTTLTVEETAFDGTYSGDETVWRTAEFEPDNGTYTVSVDAGSEQYVNTTEATAESSTASGGIIGGASSTSLLAFAAIVGGLAYAYREDYL